MLKKVIRKIRRFLKFLLETLQNEKVDNIEIAFVKGAIQSAVATLPIADKVTPKHCEILAKEIVKGLNKINDTAQKILEKRVENEK